MNLSELLQASGDRYLTAAERDQLRSCARDLELTARISAAVEAAESATMEAVITALREKYPRFGQLQQQAWERLAGDFQLVLRHDVKALLLGDPRSLDDAVLLYLRAILTAYRLSPGFVRDCFTLLRDRVSERLASDETVALKPFLQRNIDVLSDIPEPAAAVV